MDAHTHTWTNVNLELTPPEGGSAKKEMQKTAYRKGKRKMYENDDKEQRNKKC